MGTCDIFGAVADMADQNHDDGLNVKLILRLLGGRGSVYVDAGAGGAGDRKGPNHTWQFLWVSFLWLGLGLRLPYFQIAWKFLCQLELVLWLRLLDLQEQGR